ncbi:uncharacterized protein LOC62_05G007756 [Vanrija pseudolonga]|uniref:UBA domain-containing protein n=1 Tax=Vanrija pseudolonga TaxID=143232 RepID=A0AAF0YHU6_9TREE|nr:hypothetical protein LOC62_05G007756 [Vanrija pseudolonga]
MGFRKNKEQASTAPPAPDPVVSDGSSSKGGFLSIFKSKPSAPEPGVDELVAMGFTRRQVREVLDSNHGDVDAARLHLVHSRYHRVDMDRNCPHCRRLAEVRMQQDPSFKPFGGTILAMEGITDSLNYVEASMGGSGGSAGGAGAAFPYRPGGGWH